MARRKLDVNMMQDVRGAKETCNSMPQLVFL